MTIDSDTQRWLVLHGAIILVVALGCGILSVVEVVAQAGRMWQAAHAALLILGVWIIATAGIVPLLALAEPEASGLKWSLVVAGYSFMTAVILQAVTGVRAFSPEGTVVTKVAFAANLVAVLSSFLAAALTLVGSMNALRASHRSASAPTTPADAPEPR